MKLAGSGLTPAFFFAVVDAAMEGRLPTQRGPELLPLRVACHEGNYLSMISMLGSARLAER
jgi:hypothetical protein